MTERVQIAIITLIGLIVIVIGLAGFKPAPEQYSSVLDIIASGLIGALGGYAVARKPGGEG